MRSIQEDTYLFENWLATKIPLLPQDIELKHKLMGKDSFSFLRATFYRWCNLWQELGIKLNDAPTVLSVGDVHVENFGTWRDAEGRLVWGINDFDEVHPLPYTFDLIRLATSALIASQNNQLVSTASQISDAILDGYRKGLVASWMPIVLAESNLWLRDIAVDILRDPVAFWKKMTSWPEINAPIDKEVKRLLEQSMPQQNIPYKIYHRQSGLGSLGRERYTAVFMWQGGLTAREAKRMAPSAWCWATSTEENIYYDKLIAARGHISNMFLYAQYPWVIRRMGPENIRIELASLRKEKDELKLLNEMGWELALIHRATEADPSLIVKDLNSRNENFLKKSIPEFADRVQKDFAAWIKK